MLAIRFYDVVVAVHVAAIVSAFGVVATYPVVLPWLRRTHPSSMGLVHEVQGRIGKLVITPAAVLALVAGAYLASDADLWGETWVVVPLVILVALLGIGGGVFAPMEQKLAKLGAEDALTPEYDAAFRRLMVLQLAAFGLVLVAIFFMVTKAGA